jgi:phosphohistidine phosphatase SixA
VIRLLLVRHASAGARGRGASDLARPLDERGRDQAAALPDLLVPELVPVPATGDTSGSRAAPEVCTSPARRCIETVAPLAAALGTTAMIDQGLLEGADVRQLHARIAALSAPTVWSSHGDMIPELLTMLARRGLDLGPDARCSKASTWVLDVEDGEVSAARYLPPPA